MWKKSKMKINEKVLMPIAGVIIAVISLTLMICGNPGNMGFCIACFLRDIAGALGLQQSPNQYLRPEIIGIILGAFLTTLATKKWKPQGASAPVTRFLLGMCVMIGALIFLGCPLRMILRIGAGDLNAIIGFLGFAAGVGIGAFFLKKGFTLKRTYHVSKTDGLVLPILSLILLLIVVIAPAILRDGGAVFRAPVLISLVAGLVVGVVGIISKLCFSGSIRNVIFFKDFTMFSALLTMIVILVIGNLLLGKFNPSFHGQPIAHTNHLWNFLGLLLVGFGSILLSGCPFRQVIKAGSGDIDSTITVFGMLFGAAIAHNFNMASTPAGVSVNGEIGFLSAFILVSAIAVYNTFYDKYEV